MIDAGQAPKVRVAQALAESVSKALREDLAQQDRALLIVSGGSTPVPFFEALSKEDLPWERVDVTLADERWVPESDADSNTALIRRHLLQHHAAKANLVLLTTEHGTPAEGLADLTRTVEQLSWPASVVILGMGGDGHTASLFPDSPQLEEGLTTSAPLLAVTAPSMKTQARITFSRHQLKQARRHYFHLSGAEKRDVFAKLFAGDDVREYPARAFMDDAFSLYWAP